MHKCGEGNGDFSGVTSCNNGEQGEGQMDSGYSLLVKVHTTWCKLPRHLGFTHEFCIKTNFIFKIKTVSKMQEKEDGPAER